MGTNTKMKSVKQAISDIEKQFGRGAIMWLGGEGSAWNEPIEVISTGSVNIDRALGVGGLPKSRLVEIYGPESSGKTTIALQTIASCQSSGGVAAFVDAEHALDPRYAAALGIDLEKLMVSQPDSGEQALEIVEALVRSGGVDVIVVDSVAALVPRAELEGDMGDSHMGLQARLMSQAMRKLTGLISKTKTMVIFINQTRQKIGVSFGSPETTTGGNALKFYASVRLDIRRIGAVKDSEGISGNRIRARVVKNKVAPPFRDAETEIIYGRGVCVAGELLDFAVDSEIISKSGSWYTLGSFKIGQGREKARDWLATQSAIIAALRSSATGSGDLPKLKDLEKLIAENKSASQKQMAA